MELPSAPAQPESVTPDPVTPEPVMPEENCPMLMLLEGQVAEMEQEKLAILETISTQTEELIYLTGAAD